MEITDVNTLYGAYPSRHADSTPEMLVEAMTANGVDYCLTLSTRGVYHEDTEGNNDTMQACRAFQKLVPVATLDPRGYWGQPNIVEALTSFEMFRFFPHEQGWPYEYEPFLKLLERINATHKKPVMMSVRQPGDVTRIASALKSYTVPIILEGVSMATLSEAILIMRDRPNVYMETHSLKGPGTLESLRDNVGISRILFGSDAPGLSLGAALRYIRGSNLSEQDKTSILGGNAAAIWHGGQVD
jgi:predicted TIM-barrel fold metal-dependent hydrolase